MDNDKLAADIERVVNTAYTELIDLSEDQLKGRPSSDQWSIKEIVGHLIDSASNNHQRWVRLQIGDLTYFPDYGQDNEKWVGIQHYQDLSWESLLSLWRYFNMHLSTIVNGVNKDCLENKWIVDDATSVTLVELMVDYLRHLKDHLEQIRQNLENIP